MSASMKDVAVASGVSLQTVSNVINRSKPVRPATRDRVLSTASRLGYHPSALARGLMRKPMNTVGVVFATADSDPIASPYFSPILSGITAAAALAHQNAMLFTGEIWSDTAHSLPIFCDGRCDGLILLGSYWQSDLVPALLHQNVPFVLVNNRSDDLATYWVDVDDEAGGEVLMRYLLTQGHRRIAFLNSPPGGPGAERRLAGCRRALAERGDPAVLLEEIADAVGFPEVNDSFWSLLSRPSLLRPTALICVSDAAAMIVLEALKRASLRVPEEMSVAGFDDIAPAALTQPPLTTVRQPLRLLGAAALEMLLEQIGKAETVKTKQAIRPVELVVRATTAAPRADT